MVRKITDIRYLVILNCITLMILVSAKFNFTLNENFPAFVILFIIPILVLFLTLIILYISRNLKDKIISAFFDNIVVKILFALIIESAFCFGLTGAWYNFWMINNKQLALYIIAVIVNSLFVLAFIADKYRIITNKNDLTCFSCSINK